MLLMRLHEVGALAQLDEVSKSGVFLKAAGTSVLNVGKGAAAAVKDPGATAKGVGTGVKRFGTNLGRKAKRTGDKAVDSVTSDDDKKAEGEEKSTTDKAAAAGTGMAYSMLGVNKSARKWAQKVGVDPYTTNPILKKALTDLGQIDAAGGIAAKVVVPIPMVVSGTASVGNLVWAKDPEEVLKINEQKFKDLGVGADVIKQLYLSKGFSLSLHTRFATNLAEVTCPAAATTSRRPRSPTPSARPCSSSRAPRCWRASTRRRRWWRCCPTRARSSAKTKDGRAVVLLPVDWVSWTEAYEKALGEVEKRAKARARRHEARAAHDRDDVGGREEGDGRARLDRGGERALDVRGRAVAREGGPEEELAGAPHALETGATALARSSQASVLPKSRSVSRVPQRTQTRCRALVVMLVVAE